MEEATSRNTMSDFEWRTEDEYNWDNDPQPPVEPQRKVRWMLLIPALVVLLAGASYVVWTQLQQQVQVATERAESEALASAELLVQSAENNDEELIASLLSGRDLEWTAGQQALSRDSNLFDRSAFGLTLLESTHELGDVVMSAGLNSAEINSTIQYTTAFETITLQLTNTYRKGDIRWLLSPANLEFWGPTTAGVGNHSIDIEYPKRDAEFVQDRLLPGLSAALSKARLSIESPEIVDTPIRIRFRADPALLTAPEHTMLPDGILQVDMATPTLVGLPTNLRSYIGLRNGYAAQLIRIVMLEYGTPSVTEQRVETELAAQGLTPPPSLPVSLPNAEIMLSCGTGRSSTLYQSTLADRSWQHVTETTSGQLLELPDQSGVFIIDEATRTTQIVVDGQTLKLPLGWTIVGPYQGDARQLHLRNVRVFDPPSVSSGVFDLDNLSAPPAREITPPRGFVEWSATGDHAVVYNNMASSGANFAVVNREGRTTAQVLRDHATRPFWISETKIGWRTDKNEYALYDLELDAIREWLTITDLRPILPMSANLVDPSLSIVAAPNARDPYQLIVQVNEGSVPRHLLVHNVGTDQLDYLGALSFSDFVGVSNAGSFIMASRNIPNGDAVSSLRLVTLHQTTGSIKLYPISIYAQVRSPLNNDDWLLLLDAGTVRLVAPAYGYEEMLPLPDEQCRTAAWIVNDDDVARSSRGFGIMTGNSR